MFRCVELTLCFLFVAGLVPSHVAAVTVSETVTGFANGSAEPPDPVTITLTGLPTFSTTAATLTLVTFGDFNLSSEYIDIAIDGLSFGRLWDFNSSNDPFVGNVFDNDFGNQYSLSGNSSATTTIAIGTLNGLLADGEIAIDLSFSPSVENLSDDPDEFITATLVIPEPATLALLGLSGCVLITRRRA